MPEDSAQFAYNVVWSMLADKQKELLEHEYKKKCPPHIPMWKFVLYNYRITTRVEQKEPLTEISSTEKLMNNMYELDVETSLTEKSQENRKRSLDNLGEMHSELTININKLSEDIEKIDSYVQAADQDISVTKHEA